MLRECLHKYQLQEDCFDVCAIGLRARSGELMEKPRRVCTNDQDILIALRPLQCSNTGDPATDHQHAECKGIDGKESESYTFKLPRIVHKSFRKTACTTDTKHSINMCNAYCLDDWCCNLK